MSHPPGELDPLENIYHGQSADELRRRYEAGLIKPTVHYTPDIGDVHPLCKGRMRMAMVTNVYENVTCPHCLILMGLRVLP
jgi:hypothetical protein